MRAVGEDEEQRGAVGGVHEQPHLLEAEAEAVVHDLGERAVDSNGYVCEPSGREERISFVIPTYFS